MREVQASEAKTHLLRLLDDVERGETIVIRRHGRIIAQLEPRKEVDAASIRKAIAGLKALREEVRKSAKPLPTEELLAMRHEGHKY
ncbi:type II toxin-antitoxin system Phd/YefM family antitoxin [Parvibaculum sp.]|jgi:prevent-host-death family protein|uniref:type II toxin-antitoxin system Phd/YefM family antitoxin n=1 Tax=Parvibaculum sp. TaxID=2024848 RepID=UPI002A2A2349|nr:type II toxin-antitoxin system prevent-host-death family antitoxin [Parvibaculum sp.]